MPEKNLSNSTTWKNGTGSAIAKNRVVVTSSTEGECQYPTGAESVEAMIGVSSEAIADDTYGMVYTGGIVYITADAAISIGDKLVTADAAGRVKAKPSGATTQGVIIVGIALGTATAEGDIIPMLLQGTNEYSS